MVTIIIRKQARRATIYDRRGIVETSVHLGSITEAQAEREAVERADELGVKDPRIEVDTERGQSLRE